ncbi:hypothetical protein NDU88_001002 [Pleurodeles waltl]|uniref:Myb-like domain-containing protein n=2 Tax=Pleurodeles waltl TaxID=8319 RepID=A0AAV7MIG8_PLEWA|nr:hypothetical protein NDU88_001002 [Pleurodeles waltl]
MAEGSPKRRKANFTEAETEALIALVLRHEPMLFAGGAGRASPGQRRRLWEHIRRQVSPLAACPRDVEDLKKRWRDLKRRDRAKLRRLSSELQERGPPTEEGALPTPGGTESPLGASRGYIEQPGLDRQPSVTELKLKEEIVVTIVEQEEERSVHSPVEAPSQYHFPSIETPYLNSFGKPEYKTNFQQQAEESDSSGQDSLYLQQQQIRVMQLGFESVNQNLCLLQHSVQDLSSSVRLMARTLEAIKNVYVKNGAEHVTSDSCTQTTAGCHSPGSPVADDRSRSHVTESSSRSSSRSSSGISQERGPSGFPSLPLKNIKREKNNED